MKRIKFCLVALSMFALVVLPMSTTGQSTVDDRTNRSSLRTSQSRELPSGKIIDSYRRGQSGARPAWVQTALARSLEHLRSQAAAYGLDDADHELAFLSAIRDDLGQTHVSLEQVNKGVPVFGGGLIVHFGGTDFAGKTRDFANGRFFKDAVRVSTRAGITSAAALAAAKKAFGRDSGFKRETAELVVLPEAVRLGKDASGATLTYKVELLVTDGKEPARHIYFIDARNGSVVWDYNDLETGTGHGLYAGTVGIGTYFNGYTFEMRDLGRNITTSDYWTGAIYTDPDDNWGNSQPYDIQSAAVDAHYFAELTHDYYLGVHGRNSVDGMGAQMCNFMITNFGYDNAFWDGQCTNYGDGSQGRHWASADVVGHEYTHGVTQFTAGLVYQNQPGGLNESFSDIFGTRVEFYWGVNPDYLLAEDVNGAIRNMCNPRSDGNSIDHSSQYYDGIDPHFSSGLQNVVFCLLSESGNHPTTGILVKKLGRSQADDVFFRALTVYLVNQSSASFADARYATELATRDLYSTGNPYWNALRKAWYSAGVGGDVPFNPIDTSTDFVTWHYRDFLLKEPDAGGLAFWSGIINNCGADAACEDGERVHVSRAFWDSGDFQNRGDVQASGLLTGNPSHPYDNHQFVRWCYLNYLQREPDTPGWNFWEGQLNGHGDYNAIIRAFLCSQEYRERFGPN